MLPLKNRLKKKDFKEVFKKGKGFKQGPLFLKVLSNNLQKSRFGFVVGKKIFKKATERNKIKRQLREMVRARIEKIQKGADVILIVFSPPPKKTFQELEKFLDKVFLQAKILSNF